MFKAATTGVGEASRPAGDGEVHQNPPPLKDHIHGGVGSLDGVPESAVGAVDVMARAFSISPPSAGSLSFFFFLRGADP
ncbi:hypothetical protein BRADI_2g03265v3 [Brachypodium distachyon]|uniref:Uncharacterized protein n=1 Tax=Brachypodium distachyon TaxID=15368 RepID=A0A0Q3IQY3_BRADI|nr:hypothetical protein BRADI_2g03265v3 [Brachypodium distachyon]KQK02715.1 hypothetical protein BRADI_2g03265v3 [Brachypodium distachyon]KQK02716.1 hypothetical protein BRADI_2g03265v3 [Brachypodium distachyon]